MGCDIHGVVEAKQYPEYGWWTAMLDVGGFVGRNYEMFAYLFGVRNYSSWEPLAAQRGFPADASEPARDDYERWQGDAHSASWVTWAELKAVDWNRETVGYDAYVHEYAPDKSGEMAEVMSFAASTELNGRDMEALDAGEVVRKGVNEYRRQKTTLKHEISKDWQRLFQHMELLAATYGDDNVRMVVWFDN